MTITLAGLTATTAARPAGTDAGCYVTVNPNGRLSIMDTTGHAATAEALARRSTGGTVHRVALTAGITAWLDGDDQDGSGELNWAATQMCAALAAGVFTGPDDLFPVPVAEPQAALGDDPPVRTRTLVVRQTTKQLGQIGEGKKAEHQLLRGGQQQVTPRLPGLLPGRHHRGQAAAVHEGQRLQIHNDPRTRSNSSRQRAPATRHETYQAPR